MVQNINLNAIAAINNMLFGQGIKISDTPFIIIDEQDQKKYLSAYNFKIESFIL